MPGVIIDTRGLSCPLPVLKVRKVMRGVEPGTEVRIFATDPLADEDIRVYCETCGYAFLSAETCGEGELRIVIQKR